MALTDPQIQDIVNRVVNALHGLAPLPPAEVGWWVPWSAFGSYAALLAAVVAFIVGKRSLDQQKTALEVQRQAGESALEQKRQADDRAEWWRRTQWALEAAASDDETMSAYGDGMLQLLAKSKMASSDDKDLLDTAWRVDTPAASQETAEELLAEAEVFVQETVVDGDPETSQNEESKEADHG